MGTWLPKVVVHYFMLFFFIDHLVYAWFHDPQKSALRGCLYNVMIEAVRPS